MKDFVFKTNKELELLEGREVEFLGFSNMIKKGIVTSTDKGEDSSKRFWLPFCGFVNAETVKIKI